MKALERRLGLGAIVAISISSMLGSGVFVLPSFAIQETGSSAWLAYLLSALCVLPAAISKSELATAMPTSGGTYVYLERTFGPLVGTVAGLGLFFSLLLKAAFALVGFGAYLSVVTNFPLIGISLVSLAVIIGLNILGVGKVSGVIKVVVSVSVVSLLLLAVYGSFDVRPTHFDNFFEHGSAGLMAATSLVFVSFAGVTKVAAIAEEIKNPEKNLPYGIIISLILVTIIYCSVTYVLSGHFTSGQLTGDLKPIHTLGLLLGGPYVGYLASGIAILTMASMANAGILAASRFPFAMARDHLLPAALGRINQRFLTPVLSILICGLVVTAALVFLNVQVIAKLASAFILMIYVSENIAVIILREVRVQWYKPTFKSFLYPWLQVFGIVTGVSLLASMGSYGLLGFAVIAIPGIILFVLYSRTRTIRRGVIGIRGKRKDLVEDATPTSNRKLGRIDFSEDANVVVSLFGKERSPEMLIELGAALADGGKLEVVHLTEVPEQATLIDFTEDTAEIRSLRRRIKAMEEKANSPIIYDPIVSHDIIKTVATISQRLHCHWLVKEWRGRSRGMITTHSPLSWLQSHLSCHLARFKDTGVRYIRKVMVVIQSDVDNALVISTADHLAEVNGAEITFVKFIPDALSSDVADREESLITVLSSICKSPTQTKIIRGQKEVHSIIQETAEFDLLVFGAPRFETFLSRILNTDHDQIMARAACSVISVQPSREIDQRKFIF